MEMIKYTSIILLILSLLVVVVTCRQEKLIFYPEKLPADYKLSFEEPFTEYYIPVDKKTRMHGLLFKAERSKGLIFYLHGNAGSNRMWGEIADVYLSNHYDIFIPDYRGFGKSEGRIKSEKQIYSDIQIAYDSLKVQYKNIVIIGFSIGTGPATYLAAHNNPNLLILKAPYYNLPDLASKHVRIFPSFLIRYKFRTDKYIQQVKCPVVIFHGDEDEIIYTASSFKLKKLFKEGDSLIILRNQAHNGINTNPAYRSHLGKLLGNLHPAPL